MVKSSPGPSQRLSALGRVVDHWSFRALTVIALGVGCFMMAYGIPGLEEFLPPHRGIQAYRIDLDVYRLGGQVLLSGGDLYGTLPDTQIGANLPFTYPPLAAILFAPLALLPLNVASLIFTLGSLAALWLVVWLVIRELSAGPSARVHWLSLAVTAAAIWLGPVRETIAFGQINIILMALVVADLLLLRNHKWRGVLIGLALAIKLTPAVFLAYFLVKRDWRGLLIGIGSAVGYTAIGFAVTWEDSVQYWSETLRSTDRIGNLAYVSNQSLNGLIHRLTSDESATIIWFLSCAVLGIALLFLMHRLFKLGQDTAAMLVMAIYALLASPVSWSHHWVWCVPALILLTWFDPRARPWQRYLSWALSALGAVIFFGRVIWQVSVVDEGVAEWTGIEHLIGNAQLLWGLALLGYFAIRVGWPTRDESAGRLKA